MGAADHHPPLVAHIIFALGTGGLENGLVNIINRTPSGRYRHAIICLTDADQFASRLDDQTIPVMELHKRPGHDLRLYWRLYKALRSLKPAIIHTRNLTSLEMQAIAWLIPGARRVHGEHGRDIHDLEGKSRKYNLLRRTIRPLIDHYITVSKDLQRWLLETVGAKPARVTQIYNGVDQKRFHPAITDQRHRILPDGLIQPQGVVIGTVGRLAGVKDQRTLIDAFALLIKQQPELESTARLVIVGDGPLREELQSQVLRLKLNHLIWMPGDREDIPELLQAMDIFVLPSLGEGISNTLLEAMATRLPVVATRVGGNIELVEEGVNGYLVEPGATAQLAERLVEMVQHPALRMQMGTASLTRVSKAFNWDETVREYLAIYDQLIPGENPEKSALAQD